MFDFCGKPFNYYDFTKIFFDYYYDINYNVNTTINVNTGYSNVKIIIRCLYHIYVDDTFKLGCIL